MAGWIARYMSCNRLIRSTTDLASVYFILLQIDPEEPGITDEIRDGDSHGLQFRKREVFCVPAFPLHPVQRHAGIGFYTVIDLFHVMLMQDEII
jgi:hypothetical protein